VACSYSLYANWCTARSGGSWFKSETSRNAGVSSRRPFLILRFDPEHHPGSVPNERPALEAQTTPSPSRAPSGRARVQPGVQKAQMSEANHCPSHHGLSAMPGPHRLYTRSPSLYRSHGPSRLRTPSRPPASNKRHSILPSGPSSVRLPTVQFRLHVA
jgi:hypothetical protein